MLLHAFGLRLLRDMAALIAAGSPGEVIFHIEQIHRLANGIPHMLLRPPAQVVEVIISKLPGHLNSDAFAQLYVLVHQTSFTASFATSEQTQQFYTARSSFYLSA